MTKERIEDMREVVLPYVKKRLLEINYENLGESDAEEFAREFNEILDLAIKALEQEPCEDVISRKSIKQKLQEHHDFFVNAYGGFSNLPQNDKSRVDEINSCIAMVVNEPSVTPQEPKAGHWKLVQRGKVIDVCCSNCGAVRIKGYAYNYTIDQLGKKDIKECFESDDMRYCPYCGSDNREEVEE